MKRILALCLFALFALDATACSICYSGDPAQVARGGPGCDCAINGGAKLWSVALDARTMANQSGDAVKETHRETQMGLGVYRRLFKTGFGFVRVPLTNTGLHTEGEGTIASTGIGDVEVLSGMNFRREFLGFTPAVTVGIKLPTGNNKIKADDETGGNTNSFEGRGREFESLDHGNVTNGRLPEHCQLGTGSVDGLAMVHLRRGYDWRWQVTLGYRFNSENSFQYHYGDARWLDVTASRNLTTALTAGIGARLRDADHDTDRGAVYDESGGSLAALLLESELHLSASLRAAAYAAIPVINNLHGSQEEQPMVSIGLIGSF